MDASLGTAGRGCFRRPWEEIMRKPVLLSIATAALVFGGAFVVSLSNRDAAAQSSGVIIYAVYHDIAPDQMAKYIEAIKEHAAASIKEPGVREFNVSILARIIQPVQADVA
jgi:hypothetical protein